MYLKKSVFRMKKKIIRKKFNILDYKKIDSKK